ncbi:MAG: hypothetical protein HY366_02295 [Candidatus Aenigmarchaeota archaeon]|nr:hypothetical protein [Candidatus Aenigmarchaeota archaeon]
MVGIQRFPEDNFVNRGYPGYWRRAGNSGDADRIGRLLRSKDWIDQEHGLFAMGTLAMLQDDVKSFYILLGRGATEQATVYSVPAKIERIENDPAPFKGFSGREGIRMRLDGKGVYMVPCDLRRFYGSLPTPQHFMNLVSGEDKTAAMAGMVYDDLAVYSLDSKLECHMADKEEMILGLNGAY